MQGGGDFDVLIDDDAAASAYLIYTSVPDGHQMSVEKLTDDYTNSAWSTTGNTSSSGFMPVAFVEAPAAFKRGGTYYWAYGKCCW